MAKCYLALKDAQSRKLELDFLRLVYTVKELRRSGDEAQGYLQVMTQAIAKRVDTWQTKYQALNCVLVGTPGGTEKPAPLTQKALEAIEAQHCANREGMIAGTTGEDVAGRSDATAGGRLAEELLRQLIEAHEQGIHPCLNRREFPFGIRWDYYGTKGPL